MIKNTVLIRTLKKNMIITKILIKPMFEELSTRMTEENLFFSSRCENSKDDLDIEISIVTGTNFRLHL